MQWLIANQRATRHLGVETTHIRDPSGITRTSFDFVPSPGRHWMRYKNAFIMVERARETKSIDITSGGVWETLTMTTFAFQDHIFHELLEEAREMANAKDEGKTTIFHGMGHEWRPFGNPKRVRPFESVILDGEVADIIANDVHEFLGSSKWYFNRGIPYRRGYLLYGPPGTGKTSYVMALVLSLPRLR